MMSNAFPQFRGKSPLQHRDVPGRGKPYSLDPQLWQHLFLNAPKRKKPDLWLQKFVALTKEGVGRLCLREDEASLIYTRALLYLQKHPHLATYGSEALLRAIETSIRDFEIHRIEGGR